MNTMLVMITEGQSSALGAFYILAFLALVVGGWYFIVTRLSPKYLAKKRDQEIESAMRLGLRDQLAQERIAQKIANEYRQNRQ